MAAGPAPVRRDIAIGVAGLAGALTISGASVVAVALAVLLLLNVNAAVHQAELIGRRIGEPFGTLVLALAVTIIEVGLIVSIMLSAEEPNVFLARDTIHAVVVLVLHGIAGLCIVVGTLRHREQEFSTRGAGAFLGVLLPMAALTLVLPNHAISTPGPFYSDLQLGFVALACLALYASFVFVQTVRHPNLFLQPGKDAAEPEGRPAARAAWIALGLLVISLTAVVLLGKALGPAIKAGVAAIGAPARLEGVIVAAIVLLPESVTAVRAATRDRLQTSINLALGSAVACIGLTVPVVAVVSMMIGLPLGLGIDPGATVLLALSFLVAIVTYGTGRTTLLSGCVHLILLASWLFMIFAP